ncbi:MAG TPA: NUDIX hydrolase [Thermoanaerobaculia bacterium]|nr:NUDIX hydrolase [Thermoanaerobaculia bacterium]
MRTFLAILMAATMTMTASAQQSTPPEPVPAGYWPVEKSDEILRKTETIRLAPDLSQLSAEERAALKELFEAGTLMQKLYEDSRHAEALAAKDRLQVLDVKLGQPKLTQNLLALYRLNQGPIATTLDNQRLPFLPVSPQVPARNVYPLDATKEEIDAYLAANPSRRAEILGERTIVKRATQQNLDRDLQILNTFAVLRELHPTVMPYLRDRRRTADAKAFYAVPYSIAYADQLVPVSRLLMRAATALEARDEEFARYLRNRARDLLSNDYESGDASWVTGHFRNLNAQIGAYETYDDALYGVKAFHSMSILVANTKATEELRKALGGLQAIEDALPYEHHKRVKEDIPIGVYEVVADYGQARGTNTATILPNDALFSRRYGRTILLRENIMKHPDIFAADLRVWKSATQDAHANDLADEGNFQRTLWHEIGHYLGVDRDKNGRTLDVALEDYADSIEEMKSDLVSLFALDRMKHPSLRAIQASGIRRTLQNVKPRRDQPYQTMQLIQFNWFLENGLIEADPKSARLKIDYAKYPEVTTSLLREVLKLQYDGDKAAAAAFFDRWTKWTDVHEKLAARIRDAQGARFRIVTYAALGE